jgi:hypothetical protein
MNLARFRAGADAAQQPGHPGQKGSVGGRNGGPRHREHPALAPPHLPQHGLSIGNHGRCLIDHGERQFVTATAPGLLFELKKG